MSNTPQQAPQQSSMVDDAPRTFTCLVEGKSGLFEVKISGSRSIPGLKDVIMEKGKNRVFSGIDVMDLTLWRVDLEPPPQADLKKLVGSDVKGSVELDRGLISSHWPADRPLDPQHLHIVVELPSDNDRRPAKRSHVVPFEMLESYDVANKLYKAMWRQDLERKLQDVEGCNDLKYLPAAAVNDLGLRELGCFTEAILVREEYCSTFSALGQRRDHSAGIVVTGHPGIGKSVFLYYILLRLLSEGKPVALECGPGFVIFREDGVEAYEANSSEQSFNSKENTWALMDSTERSRTPCDAFYLASQMGRAWIILTTSPATERYDRLRKEHQMGLFIMECLTREEARALSIIHELETRDLLANFDKWGPSARTCLQLAWGTLTENQLKLRVEKAAEKFANDPSAINMEENAAVGSHLLFTTVPIDPARSVSTLRVATSHLRDFVVKAVAKIDAAKQVSFYAQASSNPSFRSAFGYVFEKIYYIWLSSHPDEPKYKLPCTASPRSTRSTRPAATRSTIHKPEPLNLRPVGYENVIVYGGEAGKNGYKSANDHQIPFVWIPASRSDASFDAVICTHNDIITIQVTVAATHSLKAKGFKGLKANLPKNFQKSRRWSHVFVTDQHDTAAKLGRKKYTVADEMMIGIYTTVLDISLFQYDPEVLIRAGVPQDQNEVGGIEMETDAEGEEQAQHTNPEYTISHKVSKSPRRQN